MSWNRLEFHARSKDLDPGLQACIADPLWLLARQWQFGEFQGEDAASPVGVDLAASVATLSRYRSNLAESEGGYAVDLPLPQAPLEAIVESEDVIAGPAAYMLNAEAGLHFYRLMEGLGAPASLRDELRSVYPLDWTGEVDLERLDPESRRSFQLLMRRSFDALAFFNAANDPPSIPASLSVPASAQPVFLTALETWHAWFQGRFAEFEGEHWRPSRMEYSFEVVAEAPESYLVAEAPHYADGRLEWTDFDLRVELPPSEEEGGATASLSFEPPTELRHQLLPQPVRFRGMPLSRFWEFEDRKVYLGDIDAGPADLVRLILVEFALIAGDDWFQVPLEVPIGSFTRIDSLIVTNTFGERVSIRAATEVDGWTSPWKLFTLSGDPAVETGAGCPWLFVYHRQACVKPEFRWAYSHDESIIMNGGPYEPTTSHVSRPRA